MSVVRHRRREFSSLPWSSIYSDTPLGTITHTHAHTTRHSAHTHAQMVGKFGDEPDDLAAVAFLGAAVLASLVLLEIHRRTKHRASTDDGRRRALLLAWNAVLLSHLLGVQLHTGLHLLGIAFSQPS